MPTASRQSTPSAANIAKAPPANRRRLIAAILLISTILSFGSVITHDFVYFDDNVTLAENDTLNPPTLHSVLSYWNPQNEFMALYVPVTYTVWGLCAKLGYVQVPDEHGWHLNPYVFHGASLIVHLINSLLVYWLLLRLTKTDWAAGLGAMLFALHPIQVEAVAWTSGMKDLLCTMFILLTLTQYLLFADPASPAPRSRRYAHLLLAILCTALGILSKPTAMIAPLMCGVIAHFLLRVPLKQTLIAVGIILLAVSPLIVKAASAQPASPIISGPLYLRPFVASFTVAFYLFKLVWPAHLAMDYSWYPQRVLATKIAYISVIVPILLIAAGIASRKQFPWIAAAILLMGIGILPVLGLTGFQYQYHSTVGDHYFYPSMFAIALAASFTLARFASKPAYITAAVLLLACAIRSFLQMPNYTSNLAFFDHILEVNPRSAFARVNYSRYFAESADLELASPTGSPARVNALYNDAEAQLDKAIELRPEFAKDYESYCYILLVRRRFDQANAMADKYLQCMREHPDLFLASDVVDAEVNIARRFLNLREYAYSEKFAHLAITDQPDNSDAHYLLALALFHSHHIAEGDAEAEKSVASSQAQPGQYESPLDLRLAFATQLLTDGQYDAAEDQLHRALALNPPNPAAIRQTLRVIEAHRQSSPTIHP